MVGLLGVALVFALIPRPNSGVATLEKYSLPQNQSFMSIQGQRITSEQFKNKIVIINFFTTWCPYCRQEIESLNAIRQQYSPNEVLILGITVDSTESILKIKNYIQAQGVRYPVLAPESQVFLAFGFDGGGIPVTLIYNGAGVLKKHWMGYQSVDDLKKAIAASK
jgi:thiol-disulfide isomerase/thioredoxin